MRGRRKELYLDLLTQIFEDFRIMALSQMIDEEQGYDDIGDRQDFLVSLQSRFSIRATLTSKYDTSDWPRKKFYIIHVVGPPCRPLLQEIMEFGMDCLPNIAYGLGEVPEPWPLQVLLWNRTFVRWFELEEKDDAFRKAVVDRVNLLFWTVDGNLSFAVSGDDKKERILIHVNDSALNHGLRPVIEQVS
jgi:hypothetical protein